MKTINKIVSIVSAAALTVASVGLSSFKAAAEAETLLYTVEGENLEGATLWTSIYENQLPGYQGEGFAYLTNDALSFTVDAPADGMYSIIVRGAQILSEEGRMQTVVVNGSEYSKTVPYSREWTDFDFGMVRLNKGENSLQFINKYGYMAIDAVTVKTAEFPDLTVASGDCVDPDATPETKALMAYLKSVYGDHILSGQQTIYGGGNAVQTTVRYDAQNDKCVDQDGKEYIIDKDSYDVDKDGNKFAWHCTDPDSGQVLTYDTQSHCYGYNYYDYDLDLVYEKTGKYPAIQGFDFGAACPCYKWDDGAADRMIAWSKERGGICTASWHINVPTRMEDYTLGEPLAFEKTTYSEKTDFVTANCMVEGTAEYDYFQLCIKNLAELLLKIQDAGVPVIWRPFHEAEGNGGFYTDEQGNITTNGAGAWFWWAKEGSDVYNSLWKFLYTELTDKYGVHNLIWEQNLYNWSDDSKNWYTGDEWVDIVGYDKYNTEYHRHDGKTSGPNLDAESGIFWDLQSYVKGNKMVSMPECSSVPSLDNMVIENAKWLYFCPWYDSEQARFLGDNYQDPDAFKELYNSDFCITLDELPDLFSSDQPKVTTTTSDKGSTDTTTTTTTTTTVTSGEGDVTTTSATVTTASEEPTSEKLKPTMYGDVNLDGEVTVADVIVLNKSTSNTATLTDQQKANADVDKDEEITSMDTIHIMEYLINAFVFPEID